MGKKQPFRQHFFYHLTFIMPKLPEFRYKTAEFAHWIAQSAEPMSDADERAWIFLLLRARVCTFNYI